MDQLDAKSRRSPGPKIVNNCSVPYRKLEEQVRSAIGIIGERRFGDISHVLLSDVPRAEEYRSHELPANIGIPLADGFRVSGYYYSRSEMSGPFIEVYTRDLFRGVPPPLGSTSVILIRLLRVLLHELAHHLLAERRKVHDEVREEKLADRYAEFAMKKFLANSRSLRFWNRTVIELSNWHVALAQADVRRGRMDRAEEHFYTAWQLHPKNSTAGEGFWQVRNSRSDEAGAGI